MIRLNVNNNQTIEITQGNTDGNIKVELSNTLNSGTITDYDYNIASGDMVMLLNYYRYVKANNLHCDFINSNGIMVKSLFGYRVER